MMAGPHILAGFPVIFAMMATSSLQSLRRCSPSTPLMKAVGLTAVGLVFMSAMITSDYWRATLTPSRWRWNLVRSVRVMYRQHEKIVRWLALTMVLSCLKLIMFVLDSNPQVFLGDSGTYLATAQAKLIPPDRSFVYGFLVRLLTRNSHSLHSVVAAQAFAGIATSLLVAYILIRFFNTRFVIAALAAIVLTLEPQQLLFERFVLTESFSTAAFALLVFLALEYLRGRRLWVLACMQVAGVILISLRMTFLPAVLITTILAPIIAFWRERKRGLWPVGVHLAISVVLFAGLHSGYKHWYGWLANQPPAYSYADGFFLIANVSTLVTPEDTDDAELRRVLSEPLKYATDFKGMNTRNAEMFTDGGLVPRIKDAL